MTKHKRIDYLRKLTSTSGWGNEENFKKVPSKCWDICEKLINSFGHIDNFISAAGDGSVHINWKKDYKKLDVEIYSDNKFYITFIKDEWQSKNFDSTEKVINFIYNYFNKP